MNDLEGNVKMGGTGSKAVSALKDAKNVGADIAKQIGGAISTQQASKEARKYFREQLKGSTLNESVCDTIVSGINLELTPAFRKEIYTKFGASFLSSLTHLCHQCTRTRNRPSKIVLSIIFNSHFLGDLWGPFLFCLMLAVILSSATNAQDKTLLFEIVFIIVWVGAAVISINGQLLGGTM